MIRNKATNAILIFALLAVMLQVYSCKHEVPVQPKNPGTNPANPNNPVGGTNACNPDSVYFERDVLPILISNCAMSGCHDAATGQDGVRLNNYGNVMSTADVRPFNTRGSDLYEMITEPDNDDRMPPAPKPRLTQAQIDLIAKWINQGALNKTCSDNSTCNTSNVTYAATIKPILQTNCQGCHSGGPAASGGIDMTVFSNVSAIAQNGKLYGAVNHAAGFKPMPLGGNKLPACDIAKIKAWVDNGALNN